MLQGHLKLARELEPVFNAMLENATRICEAKFGSLYLCEGDGFRVVALHGAPPALVEAAAAQAVAPPAIRTRRSDVCAATKQVGSHRRSQTEPTYRGSATVAVGRRTRRFSDLLVVPMLKEDELIGAIIIYRQEVRPFTENRSNW